MKYHMIYIALMMLNVVKIHWSTNVLLFWEVKFGDYGTNECDAYFNKNECKEFAGIEETEFAKTNIYKHVNFQYYSWPTWEVESSRDDQPKGCFLNYETMKISFNTHATGVGNSVSGPLCKIDGNELFSMKLVMD